MFSFLIVTPFFTFYISNISYFYFLFSYHLFIYTNLRLSYIHLFPFCPLFMFFFYKYFTIIPSFTTSIIPKLFPISVFPLSLPVSYFSLSHSSLPPSPNHYAFLSLTLLLPPPSTRSNTGFELFPSQRGH